MEMSSPCALPSLQPTIQDGAFRLLRPIAVKRPNIRAFIMSRTGFSILSFHYHKEPQKSIPECSVSSIVSAEEEVVGRRIPTSLQAAGVVVFYIYMVP